MLRHALVLIAVSLLSAFAHAEVLELEGTVKAVDASTRTITIERKTPKGTKALELEVSKKAGDLTPVKVGDRVSISYDPEMELVTKLGIEKPMSGRHLLKVLRRLKEHQDTKPENVPAVIQGDQNFLFGYLMGIGDARRDDFTMPTGQDNLADFRDELLRFLEEHPARLDDPAADIVCEVGEHFSASTNTTR
jgi:hypothetical protein